MAKQKNMHDQKDFSLSMRTKIILLFSLTSTAVIIVMGFVFMAVNYKISEREILSTIARDTNIIISDNLALKNNEITLKSSDTGETIISTLDSFGLSTVIYDKNLKKVASFGIFNNPSVNSQTISLSDQNLLKSIFNSQKSAFTHAFLIPPVRYDVYTTPLTFDGQTQGIIQVAKAEFLDRAFLLSGYILLIILPINILLGQLGVNYIIKKSFKPLNALAFYMEQLQQNDEPQKLPLKENSNDEIVGIAKTFNQMLDRIGEGVERQREFIANASHELKTPLARAVSSLDLALLRLRKTKPVDMADEIKKAQRDIFELNDILESLLYISKISDTQKVNLVKDKVGLLNQTKKILQNLKSKIKPKNLNISLKTTKEITIMIPKEHLKILLNNIIGNAVKYSFPKGKVTIQAAIQNKKAQIEIKDKGVGMTKEELKNVFKRFYRGKSVSSTTQGAGLGMTIVKTICDLNNLRISITSTPNKGTIVTVSNFPLA